MKRSGLVVFFLSICASLGVFAQDSYMFTLNGGYGKVFQGTDFLQAEEMMERYGVDFSRLTNMTGINLEMKIKHDFTKDLSNYHPAYDNLYYGFGLFKGIFNYSTKLNNPFGVYAVLGFTPVRIGLFSLQTDAALGFSGIWDCYDETDNPTNRLVSTPLESYIHLRINTLWRLNSHLRANAGVSFIHFSNGTILRPNSGINSLVPFVGLSYLPKENNNKETVSRQPYTKHNEWLFNAYYGVRGVMVTDYWTNNLISREQYSIVGVQARYYRALNQLHKIGLGADVSYNDGVGKTTQAYYDNGRKDSLDFWGRSNASIFLAYEFSVMNLSFIAEPLLYIHRNENAYFPAFCQRIGLRYQITDGLFAQIGLRAFEFRKADFIEWSLGYRIKRYKK